MDKFTEFLKACKMLQRNRFWAVLCVLVYLGTLWTMQPALVAWIERPAPMASPSTPAPPSPPTAQPPPGK